LFAIIGAIAADVVNSQTGFWAAMYSGFVTGFAIDAGFNSDSKPSPIELTEVKTGLRDLLPPDEPKVCDHDHHDERPAPRPIGKPSKIPKPIKKV
jgi:hypothetical protein